MSHILRDITEITRCGVQYRTDKFAPMGLKACHGSYLLEICARPGISQEQLATSICINKSNVARQAAALEEAGFIQRCPCGQDKRVTINVYNWGQYIADGSDDSMEVIKEFEARYPHIKVNYSTYDSNEIMYSKLTSGGITVDVIFPSDYMIARMINEDMLLPINYDNIPNYEYIDDTFRNTAYDPTNTYSVPYFWGSVGIVYNHENVDPKDVEEQGYGVLLNTDYAGQIYVYDSERDSFMMAFKNLGYSMNSDDPAEIQAAYEWLLKMNSTMEPTYVTDEVIDGMKAVFEEIQANKLDGIMLRFTEKLMEVMA